jgi:hypothetical protein
MEVIVTVLTLIVVWYSFLGIKQDWEMYKLKKRVMFLESINGVMKDEH